MKVLIIYDSLYGNTKKVAETILATFSTGFSLKLRAVGEVTTTDLDDLDLCIIGSPTQGGRPTEKMQQFLQQLPPKIFNGVKVALFDTRMDEQKQSLGLKLLMKTIGFAAPKMVAVVKKNGGNIMLPPQGFIVTAKEGPLADGESHSIKQWTKQLIKSLKSNQ